MGRTGWGVVVVVCCAATACGGGPTAPRIVLDGSPRRANAEGVVTDVTTDVLVLDGTRRFRVDPKLQAFDTTNLKAVQLVARKNTYVQLGVAGRTVKWLAAYSAVVELPDRPPTAFHFGTITSTTAHEVIFKDGSVLRLADGVAALGPGAAARADIDVARHEVTLLTRG